MGVLGGFPLFFFFFGAIILDDNKEKTVDNIEKFYPRGSKNLIGLLEDLLKDAEEGRLRSIVVVCETVDVGTTKSYLFQDGCDLFRITGALEHVKKDILNHIED